MFAFFADNRLLTPNMAKQFPNMNPQNDQHVPNSVPQNRCFCLARSLVTFLGRIWTKHIPKITPKSAQMAPLGAQGGVWGGQGTPKIPLCRFGGRFGVQNDFKMS